MSFSNEDVANGLLADTHGRCGWVALPSILNCKGGYVEKLNIGSVEPTSGPSNDGIEAVEPHLYVRILHKALHKAQDDMRSARVDSW